MQRWPPTSDKNSGSSVLSQARSLQDRAAELGFDWPETGPVWDKLEEEIAELREAVSMGDEQAVSHEWGDVLFTLVNLSRFLDVEPERALNAVCQRFQQRLSSVQQQLDEKGKAWSACSIDELEDLWQQAKRGTLST